MSLSYIIPLQHQICSNTPQLSHNLIIFFTGDQKLNVHNGKKLGDCTVQFYLTWSHFPPTLKEVFQLWHCPGEERCVHFVEDMNLKLMSWFFSPPACYFTIFYHFKLKNLEEQFCWHIIHIPHNLPIWSVQFNGFESIHRVMQVLPLSLKHFHHSKKKPYTV